MKTAAVLCVVGLMGLMGLAAVVAAQPGCFGTTTDVGPDCRFQPTSIPCSDPEVSGDFEEDPDNKCGWKRCWLILVCECGPQSIGDPCVGP